MCGIVGCAGDLNASHEKLMRTLLVLDSLRGEDSTGVVAVGKYNGGVKLAKQVGDPFQLFDHKSYDKAFGGFQRAIIGHNRWATSGAISRHNAHPFENNTIVGVHNGTLRNKWSLADAKNFQVDSENLYHHIDKHGLRDAIKNLDGAWALVWWDKSEDTINFLRNKERPLYLTWAEDGKAVFWASEEWMLSVALHKHQIKHQDIIPLTEDHHVSIYVDEKGAFGKPVIRMMPSEYKPYVAPTSNVTNITKKEEPAPATAKKIETSVSSFDTSYVSAKGVCIETLAACRDDQGGQYISCFDPKREYFEIRLYARPRDPVWDLLGSDIIANISGWGSSGKTPGKGYYKVCPHDFKVVVDVNAAVEEEEEVEETVMGPTGKPLTQSEFESKYDKCDWCSNSLVFGDRNRYTTGGQCVCPDCSKDSQVLEYVKLH